MLSFSVVSDGELNCFTRHLTRLRPEGHARGVIALRERLPGDRRWHSFCLGMAVHNTDNTSMKVLVTGGTGVVGQGAVSELVRRGHTVRLLSRNAREDVEQWGEKVEPWPASVTEPEDIQGSANGCDVVVHVAGIVAESPPEITFSAVNVDGTRNMLRETERAGVGRFIYLSSLGADRGQSGYHVSKLAGESVVKEFHGGWIILRPGNVYGPGDEVVSVLLKMVRTLPALPVIDGGDDRFQPVWVDDLAKAIASAVERSDLHGRISRSRVKRNQPTISSIGLPRLPVEILRGSRTRFVASIAERWPTRRHDLPVMKAS